MDLLSSISVFYHFCIFQLQDMFLQAILVRPKMFCKEAFVMVFLYLYFGMHAIFVPIKAFT